MQREYHCAVCGEKLTDKGDGLKTFTCPKHPSRFVTVPRDTSGGSEQLRDRRKEPVQIKRHTLVKVVRFKDAK